jgi:hypothetical protein
MWRHSTYEERMSGMATRSVRGLKDLGRQPKGGSGSHKIACEDGKEYVVKFADGSRNVVNEFIGYELAKPLAAPVYENALVDVNADLIKQSPDLIQRGIAPGLHHGVEFHSSARDIEGQQVDSLQIVNSGSVPAVVLLDNWILNTDRNNAGNVLIDPVPGGWNIVATDFNCSLAGNWNMDLLATTSTNRNIVATHPLLSANVSGENPFGHAVELLQQVTCGYLQSVVNTIPSTWPLTVDERIALVNCLEKRKSDVPDTINANRAQFPKWALTGHRQQGGEK